jgi:hypothetical protein
MNMDAPIKFVKARRADVKGSGGRGTMTADYQTLVKAFGKPHDTTKEGTWRDISGKTRVEWAFKAFHQGKLIVLTLYDWKEYNRPVEEVKEWSIGLKGDINAAASFLASRLGQYCFKTHRIVLVEKRLAQGSTILMSAEAVDKAFDR